jgi:arylsulfatase A-like enzyme
MRPAALLILLGALCGACVTGDGGVDLDEARGAAAGYNLLLVTLDTTRADRLGCYGHDGATTPAIDRLAAEGVRAVDAVTVAPVTLPAHASILTGLYPPEHGVRDNGEFRLEPQAVTLAEVLGGAGYDTAAFVSAFVLDARYGLNQGFERYDDAVEPVSATAGPARHFNERPADETTTAGLGWLAERDPGRPFFAWVHYFDPHHPYEAPPGPSAGEDGYDAEIGFVDRELGRLLDGLESRGLAQRTLTVIVADHGEGLGEHGEVSHTLLIYGSTMRVPLILHAPGVLAPGQVVDDTVVSVVDVAPTVAGLLDVAWGAEVDGIDLTGGAPDAERMVYMETLAPWLGHGWSPLHGIRRHRDKMILAPSPEYYSLASDPGQSNNLWLDATGSAAAGRDRLEEQLSSWLADWPTTATVAASARPLDPDERARLRALGYVAAGHAGIDDGALPDPKTMMPHLQQLNLVAALAADGHFDRALAVIEGLEDGAGESRELLLQLAGIYMRVRRLPEAVAALERHNDIRPSAEALVMLAQIRLMQRRAGEVAALLDAAAALEPHYGAIHIARGDLALTARDIEAARGHYLDAGEVDPYRSAAATRVRLDMLDARRPDRE